jgi:hypothetical protein
MKSGLRSMQITMELDKERDRRGKKLLRDKDKKREGRKSGHEKVKRIPRMEPYKRSSRKVDFYGED